MFDGPGRLTVAGVVALAAVSGGCVVSDEARIGVRLEEVAQTVSVEERETPMIREVRARHLATLLTPDVSVDVGGPFSPAQGRDEVVRMAAGVRVPAGGVAVEFDAVRVTVDVSTRRALASLAARVMAGPEVGGDLLETRELDIVFAEIAGEWLIERVSLVGIR